MSDEPKIEPATDEHLETIEAKALISDRESYARINPPELLSIIARLRAAEARSEERRRLLEEIYTNDVRATIARIAAAIKETP